jgi:hypothetical protein
VLPAISTTRYPLTSGPACPFRDHARAFVNDVRAPLCQPHTVSLSLHTPSHLAARWPRVVSVAVFIPTNCELRGAEPGAQSSCGSWNRLIPPTSQPPPCSDSTNSRARSEREPRKSLRAWDHLVGLILLQPSAILAPLPCVTNAVRPARFGRGRCASPRV